MSDMQQSQLPQCVLQSLQPSYEQAHISAHTEEVCSTVLITVHFKVLSSLGTVNR